MLKISVDDEAGKWHKSGLYIENRAPKCYFGQKMKTLVFGRWRAASETKAETVCFVITSQHQPMPTLGAVWGPLKTWQMTLIDLITIYLEAEALQHANMRASSACLLACVAMCMEAFGEEHTVVNSEFDLLKRNKTCVFMLFGYGVSAGIARL